MNRKCSLFLMICKAELRFNKLINNLINNN